MSTTSLVAELGKYQKLHSGKTSVTYQVSMPVAYILEELSDRNIDINTLEADYPEYFL